MAELYWKHGFRDWAMEIVANNPNVGVVSKHYDRNGKNKTISLRWGAQAAGFLMGINRDLESGDLIDATEEVYGEVVGYQLDSPQTPQVGGTDDKGKIKDSNNAFNEAVARLDNEACWEIVWRKRCCTEGT